MVRDEGWALPSNERDFCICLDGVITRIEQGEAAQLLIVADGNSFEWDGKQIVHGKVNAEPLGFQAGQIYNVIQDRTGAMWVCSLGGLAKRESGRFTRFYGTNPDLRIVQRRFYGTNSELKIAQRAEIALGDNKGNIWLQFARGLYRLSGSAPELSLP